MASSSLCIFSSGVTLKATSSDSRFAFWNRHSRSTAMVSDQIDIASSTMTTPRATQFMVDHIPSRLNFVSMTHSSLEPALLHPEVDCQVVYNGDGLSVERAGGELPLLHRLERRVAQPEGEVLEDAGVGDVAVAVDDGLDDDDSCDARFPRDLGV